MDEHESLAPRFETHRDHLRAAAYRMLGSLTEADDAVQEDWLRLARTDTSELTNPAGWLTTVVSRICLDTLRSRRTRREEPLETHLPDPVVTAADPDHPSPSSPARPGAPSPDAALAARLLPGVLVQSGVTSGIDAPPAAPNPLPASDHPPVITVNPSSVPPRAHPTRRCEDVPFVPGSAHTPVAVKCPAPALAGGGACRRRSRRPGWCPTFRSRRRRDLRRETSQARPDRTRRFGSGTGNDRVPWDLPSP
nr:hypothetical protein GCM10020241_05680 [Streptoalloteichus tenebrarius]